jgi:hypothetical protein
MDAAAGVILSLCSAGCSGVFCCCKEGDTESAAAALAAAAQLL